ncbi:MAG: response regulator [Chloroflexota bacterium]
MALILIVEDNPTNLQLTKAVLTRGGHTTAEATSADEVLAVLGHTTPDLILMDIQLPGMNGLTLTRQLKTRGELRSVPIVALTAYAMKGDEAKAREAGCDGYITKPIDVRTLSSSLNAILEAARS